MIKLVSIVMLSYNRELDVSESLTNIRRITHENIEVIVVDNASTDGTVELVRTCFPEVKLILMNDNIGIEAYNRGFEQARGDYIVIIDDDSFPAPNALTKMIEKFEQNDALGVVAFDVRNFYHYDELHTSESTEKHTSASSNQYIMSFNGAGVGIRADVFREVGYYPAEFFLYNNEMDTSFRIWDKGYKIEFFSDIVAYHKYSPVNRASWRAPFYYTRNAFWLVWKHYPLEKCLWTTIKLIYLCSYSSFEQRTMIYMKAMLDAFKNIDKIKGKRSPVKKEIAEGLRIPFHTFFTFYR